MRMYLLVTERAAAYRTDAAVQEAMAASGVLSLAQPTLNPGETMADLRGDLTAYEEFDPEPPGDRGYGFVRLNQLAVDHLLGAR